MSLYNRIGRLVFKRIPPYNQTLKRICQRYVDQYNGDNNSDPSTNGEEFLLRTKLSTVPEGVVFDVGANVGNWAKYAFEANPTIKLHCFEPSRPTFNQLLANQWSDNIWLNNIGLSDSEGEHQLNIINSISGLNSLYIRHGVESAQITDKEIVLMTTVDTYCERNSIEYIHFFKVDVEGHELAVFKGMKRVLSEKRVKMIQFEYGGCNLDARVYLIDIWEFLEPFGFQFYKLYPEGPKHIPTYSQNLETFKYSNWLAELSTSFPNIKTA